MNLQLRPEVQKFVDERVKAGQYASTEALIEAGIARLMLDPEPALDEETLRAIEEGEKQGDRGEVIGWAQLRAELVGKYLRK